jgi:hypothetical protein
LDPAGTAHSWTPPALLQEHIGTNLVTAPLTGPTRFRGAPWRAAPVFRADIHLAEH